MRIAPKQWTHHHTQRLYHISMLAAFLFISCAIAYGIFIIMFQAYAGTVTNQGSVNVTAVVASIEPGSTAIQTGGGSLANVPPVPLAPSPESPKSPNPPTPAESVAIVAPSGVLTKSVVLANGRTANVPAYSTQNPTFQGTTSIKNALIILEIRSYQIIRATTYADSSGQWSWTAPEPISTGQHTLFVTAQDPQNSAIVSNSEFDFFILESAMPVVQRNSGQTALLPTGDSTGNLFDVIVAVPPQFETIRPGDALIASIKLVNFGSAGNPVDVSVQYTITDSNNTVVMQSSQTVAVATQLAYLKTFNTAPNLADGDYTLTVRVPSKDVMAVSSDKFKVSGSAVLPVNANVKVDFTLFFQALLAMLFLFGLITYLEYNKIAVLSHFIKKIDEHDIRSYNYH